MKIILVLGLLGFLKFFQSQDFEIGKPLPTDIIIVNSSPHLVMTSPSSLDPAVEIKVKNIQYEVVLSKERNVSFILTFDSNFQADGVKIGDSFEVVRKKFKSRGHFVPGYGYYIKLPSEWKALFSDDKIINERKVSDTTRIKNFYKGGI